MTTLRYRVGMVARVLTRALPDRVLARIFPRSLSWDPDAMEVARAPEGAVRLLIAPVNSAGQAHLWARAAQRELADVGAVNLMYSDAAMARFSFETDYRVPVTGFTFASGWQRRLADEIRSRFTHLLIESGRYAYGSIPFRTPGQIAAELAADGVRIGWLWHGSDIRLPSAHASEEPDSPFGPAGSYPQRSIEILERNARTHRGFIAASDFPVFVSTPGLLDVERAQWLPVVVDPERWRAERAPLERERPVVAYAPSNSPMKGAPSIDEQLTALEAEGLIEYRRVQQVPSAEMPGVYGDADIVLDQFRLGDYGVAACEAMASGRVVIGHVSDVNRERVRAATGRDLPIVESRLADIAQTIRGVLADREAHRAIAAAGTEFVAEVHDGAFSARVLAPFLGATERKAVS